MMTLPAARAADLPPFIQRAMPAPIEDFASGWYLRGDVGVGRTSAKSFDWNNTGNIVTDFAIEQFALGDQAFAGIGFGYQFSSWLRFDATAEYRAKANFSAIGHYTSFCSNSQGPLSDCLDIYGGHLASAVFMANAYADLGTWWGVTPFVGAGFGTARHMISGFSDFNPMNGGRGFASGTSSSWAFAWAVHAGLAYNVSSNLKLEVAYRYINMGKADTGVLCGTACGTSTYTFRDIDSHDVKVGFRYLFSEPVPYYPPPPLMRKG
jgi:opacity protein-like surface antigen